LEIEVKKTVQGSAKLSESTHKCEELEGQLQAQQTTFESELVSANAALKVSQEELRVT